MSASMTVSEILEIREKSRRKLTRLPEFVIYEQLTTMLTRAHDGSASNGTRDTSPVEIPAVPPVRSYFRTPPEQREKLVATCRSYFTMAENTPTNMRCLAAFVGSPPCLRDV
jgi:hypothetical protein